MAGVGVGAATKAYAAGRSSHGNHRQRRSAVADNSVLASFSRLGWTEGRTVQINVRWGGNSPESITAQARELTQLKPDVIFAGPTNASIPLQKETRTIPIVFVTVSDPLEQGFVQSLARPNGNITGFSNLEYSLIGKWLQLLKEAAPGLTQVGLMISTMNASSPKWYQMFKAVAATRALRNLRATPGPWTSATSLRRP